MNKSIFYSTFGIFLLMLVFVLAAIPSQDNPLLNATTSGNLNTDNLTCWNQSTAGDSTVYNIINWYNDNVSLMSLNLPMDINNTDYSPNTYPFTVTGASHINTGYIGGAYSFDGTDDYLTGGNKKIGNYSINENFSIALWANLSANGYFASNAKWVDTWKGLTLRCSSGDDLLFQFANGTDLDECLIVDLCQDFVDTWTMIVVTKNSTHLNAYVNGSRVDTTAITITGDTFSDANFKIGVDPWNGNDYTGLMDEFRIFDIALTDTQIKNMYNYEYTNQQQFNTITYPETQDDEIWSCCMTPNDLTSNGDKLCSNNLTIGIADNNPPTFDANLVNQTVQSGTESNYTFSCTDPDGNPITYHNNVTGTDQSYYSSLGSSSGKFIFRPSYEEFLNNPIWIKAECIDSLGASSGNQTFALHITESETCDLGCIQVGAGCSARSSGGCTFIGT